jgi:peptide/nickel transport system substrate-binding protein
MRRLLVIPATLTAMCLVASACGGGTTRSGGPDGGPRYAKNATFTIVLTDDYPSLNTYAKGPLSIDRVAYDSLVHLRPNGEFVSGLAEKWSVDTTSATFTLRKGITCNDGTALTPSHVAAAITYVADTDNASTHYGVSVPKVPLTAAGDDAAGTVRVALERPFGFLLHTIGLLPIVCPKGLADPGTLEKGTSGTGPYTLTKHVPGQSYEFTARPEYTWGPGGATTKTPGLPAKIVYRIVTNETTAANLLLSGEVNLARVSGEDQQRLIAAGLKKREEPLSGAWMWFNQRGERPVDDVRVRQALVHALDRKEIIKVNTGGYGTESGGLVTRQPRFCRGETIAGLLPKYDVAAAESLLDQAGWAKGSDGLRRKGGKPLAVDLHYAPPYSSPLEKPTAELMAQRWEAIGVQVKQTSDSVTGFGETQETGNYDIYLQGYFLYLPSQLVPFASGPTPPKGQNFAGIDNKEYQDLTTKAVAMAPPEACTLWHQAEQALVRNLDIAPIADRPRPWYLKNGDAQFVAFDSPIPMSIRVFE